jgi:hypothetical protein
MKKILIYLMMVGLFAGTYSCENKFLQVPDVSGSASLSTVYSDSINAFQALMQCYSYSLMQGIASQNNVPSSPYVIRGCLGTLTDELSRGYSWDVNYPLYNLGFDANGHTDDNYAFDYSCIRANWLVAENIDKVPDMSATGKGYIKAEMDGLNAYRYMGMFIRYGGVPIVRKSFLITDNSSIPRASLDSTLNYTLQLCDTAIAGLPDSWILGQTGRLTRGAVMSIKARVLEYAARPLFNSALPYLNNGVHNNLICFGSADPNHWQTAIIANEAVLTWASQNGGYALINTGGVANAPDPNAFADYGTATSTPGNREVLLAYKDDYQNAQNVLSMNFNYSAYQSFARWDVAENGTLYEFFTNYYKADGTDQSWPQPGDAAPRPASDYIARTKALEPRFHDDQLGPGFDPLYLSTNPGDTKWNVNGWKLDLDNHSTPFPGGSYGMGCSYSVKFYYHAGSRLWFELPLFRLAETYLNLAEAYNEVGNTAKALQDLNVVHNRAGLPSIIVTDPTQLRAIIQREWAIEFFLEGQRLFQVKHWKLANIGTQILGGPVMEFQFKLTGATNNNLAANLVNYWNAVTYTKFWSPRMFLDPIPQSEINKGIAVQNPGY